MTVHEAKEFLIELERKAVDEAIDIFAEENEELFNKFFEVINFSLGNLVPDIEFSKNKCKTDCLFFTSENRELCKELCEQQNCFQCIITDYQVIKTNYELILKNVHQDSLTIDNLSKEIQNLQKENTELKAKIYDLSCRKEV